MAVDGHLNFDTKIDEKGFSGGVGKLGKIAKGGLGILGKAVGGVAAAMGTGLTLGMKYNSEMENYFTNFETMLGSASAATEHVAELKDFASKTPFEMKDLAGASQTLLSFGKDVKDVTPKLKQLGDISLGNKEKFKSLALVYGQVSSQGRLMGQDLMQCINAGFNPLLEISNRTGESMESLKERMSKGEIGIEEFDQALQWATEDGGRFAGGMEKASQTFSGLMSTLKDNAMSLLGEVVQPITAGMTEELLPAALDAIDQLTTAFRENGVEGLIEAGASVLSNLLLGITQKLPSVVETALSFITAFITSITAHLPAIVQAGFNIVTSLISGIVGMLPSLIQATVRLAGELLLGLGKALPKILDLGMDLITNLIEGLMDALPELIGYLPTIVETICQGIITKLPDIFERGIDILNSVIDGIINAIPQLIAAVPQIVTAVVNTITQNLPRIIESGIKLIASLVSGIIRAIPDIVAAIPQVVRAIWDTITSVNWLELGKNIISGIAKGVVNGVGSLVSAVKDAAKRALDSAKHFLGINSPSRVFRDQVGKYMSQGIGVGFERNMPTDEMEKSLDDAIGKVQASVQQIDVGTPIPMTSKYETPSNTDGESNRVYEIHVHTDLDGREVAHTVTPYVNEELGEIEELRDRGI